jgi:hypothetical protein
MRSNGRPKVRGRLSVRKKVGVDRLRDFQYCLRDFAEQTAGKGDFDRMTVLEIAKAIAEFAAPQRTARNWRNFWTKDVPCTPFDDSLDDWLVLPWLKGFIHGIKRVPAVANSS